VREAEALPARLKEQLDPGTNGAVSSALEELQVFEALREMLGASADARVRERRLLTWFDALRTLRFIHLIELPAGLPRMPLYEALALAPFCPFCSGQPATESDINTLRTAASDAERALPPDIGAESAILAAVNGD
jgi:hypothetical protein